METQAIHHIYNVFKYGIAICSESVRMSSAIQVPEYITLRNHLIAYLKLVTSTKVSFENGGVFQSYLCILQRKKSGGIHPKNEGSCKPTSNKIE